MRQRGIPHHELGPSWLFMQKKPVVVPADPNTVHWDYVQGKELRDPSSAELADYYGHLVSWYTQGGFTDERGRRHHFNSPWCEVFNEIDGEHQPAAVAHPALAEESGTAR
jgi:hypothetical protein